MLWSYTADSSKYSPLLSLCLSHSTKYSIAHYHPAKAKGLVWFLFAFSLLLAMSFSLCLLACPLFCLFPAASILFVFLSTPPHPTYLLILWVWMSSLSVFHCGIVGGGNCLSWPETEITLGTGRFILNGIVFGMQLSWIAWNLWECIGEIVWNDEDWIGLKDVVSCLWPNWTWGLSVGCTLLFVSKNVMSFLKKTGFKKNDVMWMSHWYICSVSLSNPQRQSTESIKGIWTKIELTLLGFLT